MCAALQRTTEQPKTYNNDGVRGNKTKIETEETNGDRREKVVVWTIKLGGNLMERKVE